VRLKHNENITKAGRDQKDRYLENALTSCEINFAERCFTAKLIYDCDKTKIFLARAVVFNVAENAKANEKINIIIIKRNI